MLIGITWVFQRKQTKGLSDLSFFVKDAINFASIWFVSVNYLLRWYSKCSVISVEQQRISPPLHCGFFSTLPNRISSETFDCFFLLFLSTKILLKVICYACDFIEWLDWQSAPWTWIMNQKHGIWMCEINNTSNHMKVIQMLFLMIFGFMCQSLREPT